MNIKSLIIYYIEYLILNSKFLVETESENEKIIVIILPHFFS